MPSCAPPVLAVSATTGPRAAPSVLNAVVQVQKDNAETFGRLFLSLPSDKRVASSSPAD